MFIGFLLALTIGILAYPGGKAGLELYATNLKDSTMKVVYIGIDNSFTLANTLPGVTYSMVSNGTIRITDIGEHHYLLRATQPGPDTLTLFENGRLVYTIPFEIRRIKDPVAKFGIVEGNTATAQRLLHYPVMQVKPGCDIKWQIIVRSFEVTVQRQNRLLLSETNLGPLLSTGIAKTFGTLKSGDVVFFDNIRFNLPSGCTRVLHLSIRII